MIEVLILDRDQLLSAWNWCEANLENDRWRVLLSIMYGGRIIFDHEEDAIWFKITWYE